MLSRSTALPARPSSGFGTADMNQPPSPALATGAPRMPIPVTASVAGTPCTRGRTANAATASSRPPTTSRPVGKRSSSIGATSEPRSIPTPMVVVTSPMVAGPTPVCWEW